MAHYITKECVACNACLERCPTDSISIGAPTYLIDADSCADCKACVPVCPTEAIRRLPPAT